MTSSIARRSLAAIAIAAIASVSTLVLALVLTQSTLPGQFFDPGAVVRWGTPIVKLVMNFSMAITI